MAEVGLVEVGVTAVRPCQQLLMSTFLNDVALVEDEDAVGVFDGGEAVGDDDGGAVLHEELEAGLDMGFGEGVDAGGGFIEDEEGGVFEDNADEGDELALATGEAVATFADIGVEAVGEGGEPSAVVDATGGGE